MRPEIETSRNHAPGALTVWLFVAIAAFLDWVARGLITPSIPARVFICVLILVCLLLAIAVAYYRDKSRKTGGS
jgi:hypothetical protein